MATRIQQGVLGLYWTHRRPCIFHLRKSYMRSPIYIGFERIMPSSIEDLQEFCHQKRPTQSFLPVKSQRTSSKYGRRTQVLLTQKTQELQNRLRESNLCSQNQYEVSGHKKLQEIYKTYSIYRRSSTIYIRPTRGLLQKVSFLKQIFWAFKELQEVFTS